MAYYLRREKKKKGTYLQMYESHWDKEKKQPRSKTGFRHLLFFVNSKNPVFKPFVAYFFVNFLNFICCTGLYFYEKRAII